MSIHIMATMNKYSYINPLRIAKSDSDEHTHYGYNTPSYYITPYEWRRAIAMSIHIMTTMNRYSYITPLRLAKSDSDEHTHYDNNEQIFI